MTATHTQKGEMTAIEDSVDRRFMNYSSIETNDGTHWQDLVIGNSLNARGL